MALSEHSKYHGLELLQYCGGGAYGEVYRCRDVSGRELAVKIVSKQKLGENYRRELKGVINYCKITGHSADLLPIFHVEEDEETFFYTMELADWASGEKYVPDTLAGRLQNGPLPQNTLFSILAGIFAGLRAIHEAGFAHRDIKPDNILFVKGVPKLGDVGLLSSLSGTVTQLAGTLDFLPPELRTAEGPDADEKRSHQRSDLYAFGKVIYCAVTGNEPNRFPEIPKDLPLSLPFKFFLRLSFQLCDRDPAKRLKSIDGLQREFAEIERKLLYGETLRDKLSYGWKQLLGSLKSSLIHSGRWLLRYYWIVLLFCAAGIAAYYAYRPVKAPDLAEIKTKTYRNSKLGFSLTYPAQWECFSKRSAHKNIREGKYFEQKDVTPLEKKRREILRPIIESGDDLIYCDFDPEFKDVITVMSVPVPGDLLMKMSDDELRVGMRQLIQGELQFNIAFYGLQRMTVAGNPCIVTDLSYDPEKTRILNYMFLRHDHCFTISVIAKRKTFAERKKLFLQMLKTLKFSKKN